MSNQPDVSSQNGNDECNIASKGNIITLKFTCHSPKLGRDIIKELEFFIFSINKN